MNALYRFGNTHLLVCLLSCSLLAGAWFLRYTAWWKDGPRSIWDRIGGLAIGSFVLGAALFCVLFFIVMVLAEFL
jgi:hypothetical protein